MMERAKITSKGQITIPVGIRREMGLEPGDDVYFMFTRGGARMVKAGSAVEATAGIFADYAFRPPLTAKEMREVAEEAWAEEGMKSMERHE